MLNEETTVKPLWRAKEGIRGVIGVFKRIKSWFCPPAKKTFVGVKRWFCPPHVCKTYRQYYGLNLKICHECRKESPLWEMNIIKHQR